jgi:hypothetical protein
MLVVSLTLEVAYVICEVCGKAFRSVFARALADARGSWPAHAGAQGEHGPNAVDTRGLRGRVDLSDFGWSASRGQPRDGDRHMRLTPLDRRSPQLLRNPPPLSKVRGSVLDTPSGPDGLRHVAKP